MLGFFVELLIVFLERFDFFFLPPILGGSFLALSAGAASPSMGLFCKSAVGIGIIWSFKELGTEIGSEAGTGGSCCNTSSLVGEERENVSELLSTLLLSSDFKELSSGLTTAGASERLEKGESGTEGCSGGAVDAADIADS